LKSTTKYHTKRLKFIICDFIGQDLRKILRAFKKHIKDYFDS